MNFDIDLPNLPRFDHRAACRDVDPELMQPARPARLVDGSPGWAEQEHRAKQVCDSCPAVVECRAWALEHNERYGVWGGLTERERINIREAARQRVRRRRRTSAA